VVAYSHPFDEKQQQDPERIGSALNVKSWIRISKKVKNSIRIRTEVMRIRIYALKIQKF
jgi:hypothetical protein